MSVDRSATCPHCLHTWEPAVLAPWPGVEVACPICGAWIGLLEALVTRGRLLALRAAQGPAWDLIRAGWSFELPGGPDADPDVPSWYWRRPGRRPGKPGRLFLSTDQAWNAMRKETKNPATGEGK